ncbi:bifunctional DNA-binding transcriptional regulator/O6-methylguanine-DNA methyltransferase Ada [Roseibacillus ishigakijimensis]|uniref:methylated-DNA--[protein]-cysteine S-methyltransferase n=1 Tax=Roseibacillus ishigakijimensis TaxID=454146 RepID=A0A934VJV5_9BACT|nr:bifunctional DNA-binding transcriptional regulator/O6-methylguanine-DNA methyltransferase Ada [Roseibacillus ishigakijimensis]MBK1832999.1 bifunctional DNA-binding transcriptional regulator/O6-methylguanine-DNA methyltransferase Ada [Roseibacillus ishigakijimensis]
MPPSPDKTDCQRWEAVCRNDAEADGEFYYAVKTTGVYCRPSCPSRQPLRKNVVFHDSRQSAEEAGFRPCKRCQPDGGTLAEDYARKVAAACRAIEDAEEAPALDELACGAAMSKFHFHRVFVQLTGLTLKAYGKAHRAGRVRQKLARGGSVTEAIHGAGYGSGSRFYEESSQILGMKPQSYRDGGVGETIRFAVGECSLGAVLVASSEKGICALSLGDEPEKLVRELQDQFSKADLVGGDRDYEKLVSEVIGFLETPRTGWTLPLDVRGTAFQIRVWNALREIPPGRTLGYRELAERIGCPKSARAVASACAANKIAVAIPCHRVTRSDGTLSGYRWGVTRKRTLIEREGS